MSATERRIVGGIEGEQGSTPKSVLILHTGLGYGLINGAPLMIGWTILLLWADRKPMERKDTLLLTLPVVLLIPLVPNTLVLAIALGGGWTGSREAGTAHADPTGGCRLLLLEPRIMRAARTRPPLPGSCRAPCLRLREYAWCGYLIHIGECIDRIESYTRGMAREAFLASSMVQDAVIRTLQTLAESTQRLSARAQENQPGIDWRKARNLGVRGKSLRCGIAGTHHLSSAELSMASPNLHDPPQNSYAWREKGG